MFRNQKKKNKNPFFSLQKARKTHCFKSQNTPEMEAKIDAEMVISEGGDVEVTSEEPGFKGAWFSATIIKLPRKKSTKARAEVQYKSLLKDDNQTPFTEKVKLCYIRPVPPQPRSCGDDQCFEVNDVVDAFHLDGWWTGSVSKVFGDPKRYIVSFACPAEDLEFSSSDLRPHWDWVDGRWVKSPKIQEGLVSSDFQEPMDLSCTTTTKNARTTIQVESSDTLKCRRKKHDLCCEKKNEMGLSTASKERAKSKNLKRAKVDGDATPLRPSKKSKDGTLADSLVPESNMKDTDHSKIKHVWGNNLRKQSGRLMKLHIEGPQRPAADKMDNLNEVASTKVKQMTKEVESSATRGLLIECMSGSMAKESCHVTREEVLVSSDCQELMEQSCNTTTKYAGKTVQLERLDALKSSSKKHEPCSASSNKSEMGLSTASKEPAMIKQVKQATTDSDATPLHPSKKSKDGSSANSLVPVSNIKEVLVSSDCQELMEQSCNTTTKGAGKTVQLERSDALKYSSKKRKPCSASSEKSEMGLSTASKEPVKIKNVKQATTDGDATPLHPSKKSKDGSSANSLVPVSNVKEVLASSDCQEPMEQSCNTTTKDAGKAVQLERLDAPKSSSKKREPCSASSNKSKMGLSTSSKEPATIKHVKQATTDGDATTLHPSEKSKDESSANSSVPASNIKEVLVSSDCQEPMEQSCNTTTKGAGKTVQLERSDALKSSSKKHEPCSASSKKREMGLSTASKELAKINHVKQATTDGDATPLHPSKKSKHGSSANSLVPVSNTKDTDPPNPEGVWEENSDLLKEVHRLLKLPVQHQQHPAAVQRLLKLPVQRRRHLAADETVEATIEVSDVEMTKESESSISKELPIECMSGTMTEKSCHFVNEGINLQKEREVDAEKAVTEQSHVEIEINVPKLVLQICQSPSAGTDNAAGAPEEMVSEERTATEQPQDEREINEPQLVLQIRQSPSAGKDDAVGASEEMVSEEHTATEVESSAISGLEKIGSQTMSTERTAVTSATDCQRKIIEVAGESGRILPENEKQSPLIRNKELLRGLRKIPSVVMEENNLGHIPQGYANQQNDPLEISLELELQSPLFGMTGDNGSQEGHDLPFVKSLPMWKAVESMEIFQVMPQNPHFRPLVELKEILREGTAVGRMLSFASMVQRTSKLTVADPGNHFTSILDALPDFEILGFDVKAIRDRATDLLLMKERHEHLQGHSKEVELQVKQYSDDLTKLNGEIDVNYKKMRELEEKQALLLSIKESKASQLTSLQVSSDDATRDIQRVEHDFRSLAGSPW